MALLQRHSKVRSLKYMVIRKKTFVLAIVAALLLVMAIVEVLLNQGFWQKISDSAVKAAISSGAITAESLQIQKLPIFNVKTEEKKIAITFNVAWENGDIPALLEKLKQNEITITFFIVGEFADQYPESVTQISEAGHEIASHSDTHPHVASMSEADIIKDMTASDKKLEALTGQKINLYRAPYGEFNETVVSAARKNGHQCIQWNIDSRDWKDPTPAEMQRSVIQGIKPGSIILFHTDKENTADAIVPIIQEIKQMGYQIVKVSDLILQDRFFVDSAGMQCPEV